MGTCLALLAAKMNDLTISHTISDKKLMTETF